jgi:5-formyltetrahydrofolate cyclo-ligase
MEEIKEKKQEIREDIIQIIDGLDEQDRFKRTKSIESRLFEFANFLEAKIVLLYMQSGSEVDTLDIIKKCADFGKIVVLPAFDPNRHELNLMKIDSAEKDLHTGPRGMLEPDPKSCKSVPIECIDIAIIPGVAMDEKGGRLGSGEGYYDRFIPKLPITTRKVGLAFEAQIVGQVPMESHDKYVDIIITEDRVIYKI